MQYNIKAQSGIALKSFSRFTFGVVHPARVAKVGKDNVTLDIGGKLETYPKDKKEWFMLPPGHPYAGNFFTFV